MLDRTPEIEGFRPPEKVKHVWPKYPETGVLLEGMESDIRSKFARIQDIPAVTPQVKELEEFGNDLESKFALLRSREGLGKLTAELLVGSIPKEDRKAVFEGIILRLQQETKYLDELADTQVTTGLLDGLPEGDYRAFVRFLDHDSLLGKLMERKGILASYAPNFDVALVNGKPVPDEQMLIQLASQGSLPDLIASLDHELTHDAQIDKLGRVKLWSPDVVRGGVSLLSAHFFGAVAPIVWRTLTLSSVNPYMRRLREYLGGDPMLLETQAYDANASSPTTNDPYLDEKNEIVQHVVGGYGTPKRGDPFQEENFTKAAVAYDEVHALRLLGMDDREIGSLVGGARFSKESQNFPTLEEAINKKFEEWGITNGDERDAILQALQVRSELNFHLERQKAKRIATEELKKESGYVNI